jgi:hypothetical protein
MALVLAPAAASAYEPPWQLGLSVTNNPVTVPDRIQLTMTVNVDLATTPYYLAIVDDDTGSTVSTRSVCNRTCTASLETGWNYQLEPKPRHLHLEAQSTGLPTYNSAPVTAEIVPYDFEAVVTPVSPSVTPIGWIQLSANANRQLNDSPYYVYVVDKARAVMLADAEKFSRALSRILPAGPTI